MIYENVFKPNSLKHFCNSSVFIDFRKNKSPYALEPQGPNLTGGFGDALTGALDVIAFTHDVDINGAVQGLNLASGKQPPGYNEATKTVDPVQVNNRINLNMNDKNVISNGGK